MRKYVLENIEEFQRLENQSQNKFYNFEEELRDFKVKSNANILDAGCGSGIVSRYLAVQYRDANVVGCDFSEIRVKQAQHAAMNIKNLKFKVENLQQTSFQSSCFDAVTCRYVLEHLSSKEVREVLSELYRITKINGEICIVDIDGLLNNVHPKTLLMNDVLTKIQIDQSVNFNIGREIPKLVSEAGFSRICWRIEPMVFQGEDLISEKIRMQERFQQAIPFLNLITRNESITNQFIEEYLNSFDDPQAVVFYNKFIVTAVKEHHLRNLLV